MEQIPNFQDSLYAIHIIEQGVNVYSENISPLFNISDALLFGFLSALYSYTYAVGEEIVKSVDFGKCKLIFEELPDQRLLLIITKNTLSEDQEKDLVQKLKLRYEVLSQEMPLSQITSLLSSPDTQIPLELIAEIRRRKETKSTKSTSAEKKFKSSAVPEIPKIVMENFDVEFILNGELVEQEVIPKIKQSLSNFFLAYKKLICALFTLEHGDNPIVFTFYRGELDAIYPIILNFTQNNPFNTIVNDELNIKKLEVENQLFWVAQYRRTTEIGTLLFSLTKTDLETIAPHIPRILKFIKRLIVLK